VASRGDAVLARGFISQWSIRDSFSAILSGRTPAHARQRVPQLFAALGYGDGCQLVVVLLCGYGIQPDKLGNSPYG